MVPRECGVPVVTSGMSSKRPATVGPHCWAQRGRGPVLPRPFTPQAPPCLSSLLGPSTLCSSSGYFSGTGHPLCSRASHSLPSSQPFSAFIFLALNLPAGSSQVSVGWRKKAFRQMASRHLVGTPQAEMGLEGSAKHAGWHARCTSTAEISP